MSSFILGFNIIFSTVHVFVRDRSVPTPVKGLRPKLIDSDLLILLGCSIQVRVSGVWTGPLSQGGVRRQSAVL